MRYYEELIDKFLKKLFDKIGKLLLLKELIEKVFLGI